MKTALGSDGEGAWLRRCRKSVGWAQYQLAAILDIHPCRISEFETGKKRIPSDFMTIFRQVFADPNHS